MKCTSCKQGQLQPNYLEGLLPCHSCSNCGGTLLMLSDYLRWSSSYENAEYIHDVEAEIEAEETVNAMICPKTGGLMTKYKISKDTEHRLDLSPVINAIWMDKGEWELLKKHGLAGKLNNIFTDHWQRDIRSQQSADVLSALYAKRFGDNYPLIKEFRKVLDTMESPSEAIAYLISEDPYHV